ncbi:MAG: MBL fold metallo-hydrolase [Thermodesulfobacteriota bacterium]
MRLTVLGSGSCELRARRSSPAYLVEEGAYRLLLDLGAGAWRRLTELGRDPASVAAVALSHPHPDHLGDLVPLLFALNYDPNLNQGPGVDLLAPAGLEPILAGIQAPFGAWLRPPPERLRCWWLEPGQGLVLGPLAVTCAPAAHTPQSLAWRIAAGGASLVYLGDSAAAPWLIDFCRGADLLLAHCAGGDEAPKPGHIHPRAAGELARRAGVRALLLSHFYRDVDPEAAVSSAAAVFGGPVWAAVDGAAYLVREGGAIPLADNP